MTGGLSDDAFRLLEGARGPVELRVRESEVELDAGRVLHAVDRTGRRHLLVPVPRAYRELKDDKSAGVSVATRLLEDSEVERRFIDVRCEALDLSDLFAVLCDEMLEGLAGSEDPGSTVIAVLDRWRKLLGAKRSRLLSREQLFGLLAELLWLGRLCRRSVGALELWTGPRKARHDFMSERISVEVKATTARDALRTEIHGITQLDVDDDRRLCLHVVRLEQVPEGGTSVPEVVDALLALGVNRGELLNRLADSGYSTVDAEVYRRTRAEVREELTYHVDDDFPRLVPGSLKDAGLLQRVSAVRYTLDLSVRPPAPLSDAEVASVVEDMAGTGVASAAREVLGALLGHGRGRRPSGPQGPRYPGSQHVGARRAGGGSEQLGRKAGRRSDHSADRWSDPGRAGATCPRRPHV